MYIYYYMAWQESREIFIFWWMNSLFIHTYLAYINTWHVINYVAHLGSALHCLFACYAASGKKSTQRKKNVWNFTVLLLPLSMLKLFLSVIVFYPVFFSCWISQIGRLACNVDVDVDARKKSERHGKQSQWKIYSW